MMKKILISLFLLLSTSQAKEYKVVFNCSSNDAEFIKTRMWLVDKTITMIQEQGNSVKAALTIHGGCTPLVSKSPKDIVADEDLKHFQKAQEHLTKLVKEENLEVVACAISLKRNLIEQNDVLDFITISPNSFIDTIAYQNDGYAIITFH